MTATMEGTADAVTELPRLLPPRDGKQGDGKPDRPSDGGRSHDFRIHALRYGMPAVPRPARRPDQARPRRPA